jgi:hypothetical protein
MKERILKLRSEGKTYREIAAIVGLSKTTVDYYCNIEKKLQDQRVRRKNIKRMLVEMAGGKCILCGYNKCLAALNFHHADSTKKDFHVSRNKNLGKTIDEMKKCILVCSNCHDEIHDGFITI